MLCSALASAGFTPHVPPGAYYVLADISSLRRLGEEKARTLLRERGVAAVAGTAFFHEGRGETCCASVSPSGMKSCERACDLLQGGR